MQTFSFEEAVLLIETSTVQIATADTGEIYELTTDEGKALIVVDRSTHNIKTVFEEKDPEGYYYIKDLLEEVT